MNDSKRVVLATADGSATIAIPALGITYHSKHGALQESIHVFIKSGLEKAFNAFSENISVLEMGFGTGLNALLTVIEGLNQNRTITYTSLELYPLSDEEIVQLNHGETIEERQLFRNLHKAEWNKAVKINPNFSLQKIKADLLTIEFTEQYHVIYFDAFSPEDQPELWTETIFKKLFDSLVSQGMLVTYCSKSIVRKAMQAAGFSVEKIPGPRGKREIVRATRPIQI